MCNIFLIIKETKSAQKQSGARMNDCGEGQGIGVDLNRNFDAKWVLGDPMIGASKLWFRRYKTVRKLYNLMNF